MSKTIVVCGYGPGISDAVARKFGAEGFSVALVARTADKLAAAAASLGEAGVKAKAFACDLGDPAKVKAMIDAVRADLGPVTALHYNAYQGSAGDVLACDPADVRQPFDVSVTGLIAAVQAALPDLRSQEEAAVLVTGGGFAFYDKKVDAMIVSYSTMGLGIAKAAQHKLVGILSEKLAAENIFVGEVVVLGMVKGTAFDAGGATLEASAIADAFWRLYTARDQTSVSIS